MKVLFVDDEPDVLEQAKIFLEREKEEIEVETASSAEEGLELLNEKKYDFIISDYKMPEMDGLEFLEHVRENLNSGTPFIILTGKGREDLGLETLEQGAQWYIEKETNPESQYKNLANAMTLTIERGAEGARPIR